MSSTDSTELEDSTYQEYIKDEIDKQNFSTVIDLIETVRREGKQLYMTLLKVAYEHSVTLNYFDFAEELFREYPELLSHEYFLNPSNITELCIAASVGHIGFMRFLLNTIGVSPKNKRIRGCNLFEFAVLSSQLEASKFIREELEISSNQEELVLAAVKIGHEPLVKYLYEDVGIEVRRHLKCLLNAIKCGSITLIQYLYEQMGIRVIEDTSIVELAIYKASKTGSIQILELLLNFEFKVRVNMIKPFSETSNYSNPLYSSMIEASKHGMLEVIQFVHEVLKVELATDDPMSNLVCYVDMLKYAAEGGHEAVLDYLLNEVKLSLSIFPSQQKESLLLTILNSDVEEQAKQCMLLTALPLESQENFVKVLEKTTDEQRLLLGQIKRRAQGSVGPRKVSKSDVVSKLP